MECGRNMKYCINCIHKTFFKCWCVCPLEILRLVPIHGNQAEDFEWRRSIDCTLLSDLHGWPAVHGRASGDHFQCTAEHHIDTPSGYLHLCHVSHQRTILYWSGFRICFVGTLSFTHIETRTIAGGES